MKKIILSLLTLAALVVGAQAQGLVTLPVVTVAASVNSNGVFSSAHVLDVRRQQNVAIEWTHGLAGAGSGSSAIVFSPSLDGSTVDTTLDQLTFNITRAANGTTRVTTVTNLNCKGYNYLLLTVVSNAASANIMTNTIRYWVKPNAP